MSIESTIPCLGETIADRYQLESVLGYGGMGLVYSACDTVLGRRVAIKLSWADAAAGSEAYARFRREARMASALRHPGAIEVYDFGASERHLFLTMELLEGVSLARRLRARSKLLVAEAVSIGRQIGDVLAAAHSRSVVHRDLKPGNIFLDTSKGTQRVVVLDFGLAFAVASRDQSVGRLTWDKVTLGTPSYMSPEQISDEDIGPSSDVYALGCLLFELCTGAPPFTDRSPARVLTRHLHSPAPRLCDVCPQAPEALDQLLSEMLAKCPEQRPTARQVCERLAGLKEAKGPQNSAG